MSWSGTPGPGATSIASYTIYESDDGGPFTAFLTNTTLTSTTFTGQPGHTYGFYSVATDNFGDVQPTPAGAQATVTVANTPTPTPNPIPTQTVIIGEQSIFQRKFNKKGKAAGKAVLTGFTLDYGLPLSSAAPSNYQLDAISIKKVKKIKETILHPITNFRVWYLPTSDAVEITLGAIEKFRDRRPAHRAWRRDDRRWRHADRKRRVQHLQGREEHRAGVRRDGGPPRSSIAFFQVLAGAAWCFVTAKN